MTSKTALAVAVLGGLLAAPPKIEGAKSGHSFEELQNRIQAIRPTTVAWRKIPWKSCLLDGIRESRAQKKPILLWIFIDRPVDDARC